MLYQFWNFHFLGKLHKSQKLLPSNYSNLCYSLTAAHELSTTITFKTRVLFVKLEGEKEITPFYCFTYS